MQIYMAFDQFDIQASKQNTWTLSQRVEIFFINGIANILIYAATYI